MGNSDRGNPLTPLEQAAVERFKNIARQETGDQILSFCVFGSRARGEGDETSDLDILVLVKEERSEVRNRLYEISADILLEYEVDISPLVLSRRRFDEMKGRERLLIREIERDGLYL